MNSIPESHKDLLERPIIVSLATLMPDGQPQVTPIWADLDNGHIRVNTVAGRQKYNNLKARQQATVLVFDPENPMRYIEVRGEVVSESESDGIAVIDKLARDYLNQEPYPWHNPADTRVTFRIRPTRVTVSG